MGDTRGDTRVPGIPRLRAQRAHRGGVRVARGAEPDLAPPQSLRGAHALHRPPRTRRASPRARRPRARTSAARLGWRSAAPARATPDTNRAATEVFSSLFCFLLPVLPPPVSRTPVLLHARRARRRAPRWRPPRRRPSRARARRSPPGSPGTCCATARRGNRTFRRHRARCYYRARYRRSYDTSARIESARGDGPSARAASAATSIESFAEELRGSSAGICTSAHSASGSGGEPGGEPAGFAAVTSAAAATSATSPETLAGGSGAFSFSIRRRAFLATLWHVRRLFRERRSRLAEPRGRGLVLGVQAAHGRQPAADHRAALGGGHSRAARSTRATCARGGGGQRVRFVGRLETSEKRAWRAPNERRREERALDASASPLVGERDAPRLRSCGVR